MSFFGHGSIREEETANLAASEEPHCLAYVRAFGLLLQSAATQSSHGGLGASPAGETPKTLERLQRAMASRHALLHVHASLDPNVAIRFILGWVKLCTIV